MVGHNTFKNSVCLGFNKYYTLIDNNSSLVFSLNDLQKLGYLMYYYFFIWTLILSTFLTLLLVICLNLIIKNIK